MWQERMIIDRCAKRKLVVLESAFGMEAMFTGLVERGYSPTVVYDIGASDGSWTRWAAPHWPGSRFVCFEPHTETGGA